MLSRTRSRIQAILWLHPNEEVVHALHHYHVQIMSFRKASKNWLISHPSPLVESRPDWRNQIMLFGYRDPKFRKQGNEHSLCGLAGAFSTRINVIVVTTSGHHIQQYNPPGNTHHTQELCLIYMDLENTRHYLSTTPNMVLSIPPPPPPTRRGTNGHQARSPRVTGSSESINDPAQAVGHGGYFREYQSRARWLRTPPNSKRGSQISSADLPDGYPLEATGLQKSTDITKWGNLQGIHPMTHPNSHSGQIVSIKNTTKGVRSNYPFSSFPRIVVDTKRRITWSS